MLQYTIYQNQSPDADPTIYVGDSQEIELTVQDANGADWPNDWTAELIVRRSNDDSVGEITIPSEVEATPLDIDNVFYFNLSYVSFEAGTYTCILRLTSDDATPLVVSFKQFPLEVLA